MIDEKLIAAVRSRAARDAEEFRAGSPPAPPNEKWIDNRFTAALPLAKDDVHVDLDTAEEPALFDVYKREVERVLGLHRVREDTEADRRDHAYEELQEPTAGEN